MGDFSLRRLVGILLFVLIVSSKLNGLKTSQEIINQIIKSLITPASFRTFENYTLWDRFYLAISHLVVGKYPFGNKIFTYFFLMEV